MTQHPLPFALLAIALVACDETTANLENLPVDQAPVVLSSSPEWDLMTSFESDPDLELGTHYGEATATLDNGWCSAGLIDDDILVTADQCRKSGPMTAKFGEWGFSNTNHLRGINTAKQRLKQLGVPATVVDNLNVDLMREFSCTFQSQDGTADVAYYECLGNDISWTANGNTFSFRIKPGHLWGHYNVDVTPRLRTDVYMLSVANTCAHPLQDTLLSPGDQTSTSTGCNTSGHTDCFNHDLDSIGGTAGGVIVDGSNHKVYGVHNGYYSWQIGDPNNPCQQFWWATNTGSYMGSGAATFTNEDASGGGWSLGDFSASAGWVGGSGGNLSETQCLGDRMAAGIVGSTSASGTVGNFGLICAPHRPSTELRLDRSRVIAGGSLDVGLGAAQHEDWNTYMNEVRTDTTTTGDNRQIMAMCPAGSFIWQIRTKAGAVVDKIVGIDCEDPQTNVLSSIDLDGGTGLIGTSSGGTSQSTTCPFPEYVSGLHIRAGHMTDGFKAMCRLED